MQGIWAKACCTALVFCGLSVGAATSVSAKADLESAKSFTRMTPRNLSETAVERSRPNDPPARDSIRRQQRIYEQLDFISEQALPLLDVAVNLPMLSDLTPLTIEGRLKKLERSVPLPYNEHVQRFIDRYSTDQYRGYLSRMLGLGTYYFELFDRILEETGLPKELKYLTVVESALNPHAVSRAGATGPWQFMFATAKMYGLQMDSDIDERKDPVTSSYAASRYLLEAYQQFGDWLLAIASYNCGPGNVLRAIRRSGLEKPDYWAISPYLPRETRNYVPAFIAMTYMLEYHQEHGITPSDSELSQPTETVTVQQAVHFSAISDALDLDIELIRLLNPAYKKDVIKGSFDNPHRLVLPVVDPTHYANLYAVLNEAPASISVNDLAVASTRLAKSDESPAPSRIYTVKKGDSLSTIAARHKGATVSSIKMANGLKGDRINPGMKLKIQ